jgi:putative salt-induced outer membrane protein YdiY
MRFAAILAVVLFAAVASPVPVMAAEVVLQPLQQVASQAKNLLPDQVTVTNHTVWLSSLTLGFTMTRGNSDTLLVSAKFRTERKLADNEWLLGANGAYGEDHSVKNYETLHGFGQFNHFFTSRLYAFGRLDGLHDGIKDIKYRATVSPGLGYYLMKQTNATYAVEAGPSFVSERQGEDDQNYAAFRLAERFEYKLNSRARIWHSAELIPQMDQPDNFIINADIGVESPLARDLSLQVYVQDNYVNQPTPTYKHNDVRIVSGISYKF